MTEKQRGQITIFDMIDSSADNSNVSDSCKPMLPDVPKMSMSEKLENEKAILGFYVSGHPLNEYQFELNLFTNMTTKKYQDKSVPIPESIIIAGIATSITEKTDRNKRPCLFISFEDMGGRFEIAIFNKEVETFRHQVQQDGGYVVFGKQSSYNKSSKGGNDDGILRIIPTKIVPLIEIGNNYRGKMLLGIDEKKVTADLYYSLSELSNKHTGNFAINLKVKTNHFGNLLLSSGNLKVSPNQKVHDTLMSLTGSKVEVMLE
jgi:DNA polymerase-3 subunit alpha